MIKPNTVGRLVLPSVSGDSLAELNRLRRESDAATGIPTRLLYRDPPLHPTETEHLAEARARFRNALDGKIPPAGVSAVEYACYNLFCAMEEIAKAMMCDANTATSATGKGEG